MGTVLQVTSGVAAFAVAVAFVLLFHFKINAYDVHSPWKYESRHAPERVSYVPRTYIPTGAVVRYKELWRARIEGTADYLRVPVWKLEECYQKALAERLSDWKWMHVPSGEWPAAWQ